MPKTFVGETPKLGVSTKGTLLNFAQLLLCKV